MKKQILKNLFLNFFIVFITGGLFFIINKCFVIHMGIENLGLMKLFTQMIGYLNLAELGLASASSYALYKPLEEKDKLRVSVIVSTISYFYKKIAIIVLIVGIIASFLIPTIINSVENNRIYIYWILYVINTVINYTFAKYPILFTANQEYAYVKKIQGSGKIIFQIFQIIILIKTKSFSLFIFMMILENFYNYYFYKRHYEKKYSYLITVKDREKTILRNMKNLFWHKIGALIVFNTDYIVLSKFISLSIVGVYSSYLMIYQMTLTLMGVLTSVLRPTIGALVVKNTKESIYNYWRGLYSLYTILGTIFIINIYILIVPFIKLWLGEKFLLPNITIILILINLFIHLTRGITDIFKDCFGFFDDTYIPILESIINLILSLVLVKKIGLNGVIIGTLVSNIIVILFLRPILVFKRCFQKQAVDYIKILIKLLILSFVSINIILILIRKLNINLLEICSWEEFLYKSLTLGVISTIIVIIIFLIEKDIRIFIITNLRKKGFKCEKIFWNRWNKRRS